MYTEFYSLKGMAFQLTPDGKVFFGSAQHKRAMAFLNYGIAQAEGFIVISGEVGAGKTTLAEHLLSTLDPARYVAGRIVTTQLDHDDMLRMIGAAFDVFREGMDKTTLLMRIKQFVSELRRQQRRALLIVDEAQSLPLEALEELRLLTNVVVDGSPLLQPILLGQPELRAVLASRDLEHLRQRVIASCHLGALTAADTKGYVEHRLKHVGWSGDPSFSDDALADVHHHTGGIPRRINVLCSRLLLLGFLDEKHRIDRDMVATVASELAAELGPFLETNPRAAQAHGADDTTSSRDSELRDVREVMPRAARGEPNPDPQEKTPARPLGLVSIHPKS